MTTSTKIPPTGFTPDHTPQSKEKSMNIEALTTAPQKLSEAETPLGKMLEGKTGNDEPEKDLNYLNIG